MSGDRLAGKVALITGAARGQGAAEARLFARAGATVILVDILDDQGRSVAKDIGASYVHLDVTSEDGWRTTIDAVMARYGRLDVLVNNAGIPSRTRIEELTREEWDRVMAVNLTSVFLGTKHAIPAMRRGGGGSIVNISSMAGLVGTVVGGAAYGASKGAIRIFTKATAIQCAKDGIRCNSVHPGPIVSDFTASGPEADALRSQRLARIPLGRRGTPDEVAYGVLYLASDESSFVTGSELVIDGGWTAQ